MPAAPMPQSVVGGISDATDPVGARRLPAHEAPRDVVAKAREMAFSGFVGTASAWKPLKKFMQSDEVDKYEWRNAFRADPLHAAIFQRAMDPTTDENDAAGLRQSLLRAYAAATAANVPKAKATIAERIEAHVAKAAAHVTRTAEEKEAARVAREAKAGPPHAPKASSAAAAEVKAKAATEAKAKAATEAKAKARPKASHTPPPPTGEGRSRRPRNK